MSTANANLQPSTKRPIPLRRRSDLVTRRIEYQGLGSWVIKDPVGLKYHRLQPEQYTVLGLLDGRRSLEEIRDAVRLQFPTLHFTLPDVQSLITDLHQKGLVLSDRPGQAAELIRQDRKNRRQKLKSGLKNILYLRLPGWDPEIALRALHPLVRWMFRPWAVAIATLLIISAMTLLTIQFDTFQSRLPGFEQFFGWPNLIYLWFTLGAAKVIHEFAHGISCLHFGGECHEMGVMLLVFSPCLYCDVSDSWMMRNKWHRIIIAGAGMAIEVVLSAIAIFIWWNTQPGLLNYLCLNVFFVTTISTVIFNANPLMRFDGYYMLSDLMEIPNLRPKADRMVRDGFAWYCLGIETRPDPFMPETGRFWFALFAVSAALYRWVILFGITLFLYTFLKPYGLQSLGIALAVFSVGGILVNMLMSVYRIIVAPRNEPMSRPKIAITLLLLVGIVGGGLMLPLPLHVHANFIVEPEDQRQVFVTTAGELTELHVRPGAFVQEGDLLASLTSYQMEDQYRDLLVQAEVQRKQVDLQFALDDPAAEQLATERLEGLLEQIADIETQMDQLRIHAPISGIIVEPEPVPPASAEARKRQLATWDGTPLDAANRGAFLEEGTHLLSIAPRSTFDAILLIDQGDRNDIAEGSKIEIQFDHLPGRIYDVKLAEISDRHVEYAPPSLSNKLGGDLATVTDAEGRERLNSVAYRATVLIDRDLSLIKPGMRGRGRFLVARRTAGEWIWRYLRRTFHFRL